MWIFIATLLYDNHNVQHQQPQQVQYSYLDHAHACDEGLLVMTASGVVGREA